MRSTVLLSLGALASPALAVFHLNGPPQVSNQVLLDQLLKNHLAEFKKNTGDTTNNAQAVPFFNPLSVPPIRVTHFNLGHLGRIHKRDEIEGGEVEGGEVEGGEVGGEVEGGSDVDPEHPKDLKDLVSDFFDDELDKFRELTKTHKRATQDTSNPYAGQSLDDILQQVLDDHLAEFKKITGVKTDNPGAIPPEVPVKQGGSFSKRSLDGPSDKPYHEVLGDLIKARMAEFKRITGYEAVDNFAHPPDPRDLAAAAQHDEFRMRRIRRNVEILEA